MLTLVKAHDQPFEAVNQRLLLLPLIFSRGALICSTDHPRVLMVTYQARGAAVPLRPPAPTTGDDRLAILVGRGRATVLRALTIPATTSAAVHGARAGTEHGLGAPLRATGGRRGAPASGRARVLYGLEPAGIALVGLIGEDSVRTEFVSSTGPLP